jgi:hypothetical protein
MGKLTIPLQRSHHFLPACWQSNTRAAERQSPQGYRGIKTMKTLMLAGFGFFFFFTIAGIPLMQLTDLALKIPAGK